MDSLLFEESFNFTHRKQIKTPKRKPQPHNNNNNHNNFNQIQISRQSSLSNPNYAQQPQFIMHEFDFNNNMIMHGGYYSHNNHHTPPYNNLHASNSLPPMSFSHHYHQPPPPLNTVSKPVFQCLPLVSQGVVPRKTPTKQKSPLKRNNSAQFSSASKDGVRGKEKKDNLVGPKKEIVSDPETIAKDLTRMLLADLDDKFSESVFNLAPPASSLPVPKFLLKVTLASA